MQPSQTRIVLALFLCGTGISHANFSWNTAGPADWNDPLNWTDTGVPNDNDRFVNNGGTATITSDVTLGPYRDAKIGFGAGTVGTVNHSAGANNVPGWLFMGVDGGRGTYNLAGGPGAGTFTGMSQGTGSVSAGDIRFGEGAGGGIADININTEGSMNANGWLYVGVNGGSTATMNLDNGSVNATGIFLVGQSSNGFLNMSGGSISANEVWIGNGAGGNAQVNHAGGSVSAASNWLAIGREGAVATYNLSGSGELHHPHVGTHTIIGSLSGQGTLRQTGGLYNETGGDLRLGENAGGVGTYDISAGIGNVTNNIIIGWVGGGTGIVKISNTGDVTAANVIVGDGGAGTLSLNGGRLTTNQIIRGGGGGASLVEFNGGVLRAASSQAEMMPGHSDATTEILAGGLRLNTNGMDVGTGVGLDGIGGLTKMGGGTLTLSGVSTYTGATFVSEGTLSLSGSLASATTVQSSATLMGTGTVFNNVTVDSGGVISPGNSIGTFTVIGSLTIIGGLTNETDNTSLSDLLDVTGSVTLGATSSVALSHLGGAPSAGDTFLLIRNDLGDAISGQFSNLADNSTVVIGGMTGLVDYQYDSGSATLNAGNDLAIRIIPEPAGTLLAGLAAAGLLVRRRRA